MCKIFSLNRKWKAEKKKLEMRGSALLILQEVFGGSLGHLLSSRLASAAVGTADAAAAVVELVLMFMIVVFVPMVKLTAVKVVSGDDSYRN